MAKIKIHELAKELEVSSKEVITFLNDKGIEVKSHMSSIEDDAAALVKARFGKKSEAPKAEAPKAEAPKAEAGRSDSAKADSMKQADAPKKKKNIIFVSNMQNSSMQRGNNNRSQNGGNRQNGGYNNGNNGRPGNGRPVIQQQQQHRPLPKPIIKPAALPSIEEEFGVPEKAAPAPNRNENRNDNYNRGDNRRDNNNRGDNRGGNRNEGRNENRGDYRNNRNDDRKGNFQGNSRPGNGERRQGGYRDNRQDNRGGDGNRENNRDNRRPYGNNDRPNRGDGRPGNNNFRKPGAPNKGFTVDAPIKDQEKHRDEEKRRQGQERDKRSKKDHLYEEDEMNAKSKMNKPGRFIKPEKKVEEKEEEQIKVIVIPENLTVKELADKMKIQPSAIVKKLFLQGQIVTVNQEISYETAEEIAMDYDILCEKEEKVDIIEELLKEDEEDEATMQQRPPVICVMGHVDHGKTSLLDAIRKTNVTDREAGGITQHIGAYSVTLKSGRKVTFLDTPGHEAFTAMRARGAQATDIAIIIIAADDSVMPTTKEAIAHAQAAGVPMVFAINKIDKPGANPDRIREDLANMNLLVEEWGGKYQCQEISAKKGIGVHELLDKVLLEADMLDLKANPNRRATGTIIESSLDKGRGYVSTVLVANGTLKVGDIVLAGTSWGRVKAMFNERNANIKSAAPAEPAIILGLNGAPTAGDQFHVIETEQEAREIATKREQLQREQGLRTQKRLTLGDISHRIARGEFHELNVIVKGDTDGSVEALSDSFIKLSTEKVQVNVVNKAVGQISENDVMLASASDAIIVGFQVRPSADARKAADREGVEINTYSIIYDAIDDIKSAMVGMLDKVKKEIVTGQVEVKQTFKISKVGTIAGGLVTEGKVHAKDKARVIRDGIVIRTAEIGALKRYKDDVKEVVTGMECGLSLVNYNDIQEGDVIETFTEIEVEQKL